MAFLDAARSNRHGVRRHAIDLVTGGHPPHGQPLRNVGDQGDELRVIKAWLRLRPERSGIR